MFSDRMRQKTGVSRRHVLKGAAAAAPFAAFPALRSKAWAADEPIELTISFLSPQTHPHAKDYLIPIGNMIEERTGGRVKVVFRFGEVLGAAKDQYFVVRDGLADIAYFPTSYTPGRFPSVEIASLPYAASTCVNINKALGRLQDKGYFDREFNEVIPLHFLASSPYNILFPKLHPTTVAELKGLKLRSPGAIQAKVLEALGAVPVTIMIPEGYQALQTGLVDGWLHSPATMLANKWYEVAKNYLELNFSYFGATIVAMNKDTPSKFPPDLMQAIRDVWTETRYLGAEITDVAETAAVEELKKNGVEVYRFAPEEMQKFRDLIVPQWAEWVQDMNEKGAQGTQMMADFVAVLRELRENPPYNPA